MAKKIERIADWLDDNVPIDRKPFLAILVLAGIISGAVGIVIGFCSLVIWADRLLESRFGWPAAAALRIFAASYFVAIVIVVFNRR